MWDKQNKKPTCGWEQKKKKKKKMSFSLADWEKYKKFLGFSL